MPLYSYQSYEGDLMGRVIAIGDVHGMITLLRRLLEQAVRYIPGEDQLIFLGDLIDRGENSREVIEYVMSLLGNPIIILGNHEQMAMDYFNGISYSWLGEGGSKTLRDFGNPATAAGPIMKLYKNSMGSFETDTHCFLHGGLSGDIRTGYRLPCDSTREDLLTKSAHPMMEHPGGKILVVGHNIQEDLKVKRINKVIFMDTGAFITGVLSACDVTTGTVFQVFSDGRSETYRIE
jgi:serine/threonine protein phosphatase 1